jgi:hypothetical protein
VLGVVGDDDTIQRDRLVVRFTSWPVHWIADNRIRDSAFRRAPSDQSAVYLLLILVHSVRAHGASWLESGARFSLRRVIRPVRGMGNPGRVFSGAPGVALGVVMTVQAAERRSNTDGSRRLGADDGPT